MMHHVIKHNYIFLPYEIFLLHVPLALMFHPNVTTALRKGEEEERKKNQHLIFWQAFMTK